MCNKRKAVSELQRTEGRTGIKEMGVVFAGMENMGSADRLVLAAAEEGSVSILTAGVLRDHRLTAIARISFKEAGL
jgi:hypothetical protein